MITAPKAVSVALTSVAVLCFALGCADKAPAALGHDPVDTGFPDAEGGDGGADSGGDLADTGCPSSLCGGVCCGEAEVCVADACTPLCGFDVCEAGSVCENQVCKPECAGVRCGSDDGLCCTGAQVCVFELCLEPGASCTSDADCAIEEFCEVINAVCIPSDTNPNACLFVPPVGDFSPQQEWAWDGTLGSYPTFDQVMMMPAVANLTDDNGDGAVNSEDIPDIVFTSFAGSAYNGAGVLRILSGDDGSLHHEHAIGARAGNCPAIADIDGNGVPEILVERAPDAGVEAVMAVRGDGSLMWENQGLSTGSGGVAVADLDGDGSAEVIALDRVIGSNGDTLCTFVAGSAVPISADLDLDGVQEIFNGSSAFDFATDGGACPERWTSASLGYPAVGNFDDDPEPELVTAGGGRVAVLDDLGQVLWDEQLPISPERVLEEYGIVCEAFTCDTAAPNYLKGCCPGGGPPTVADVDNDGQVEITVAARWFYVVYETDGSILWAHATHDFSSAATGSSVFDFEGDGRAEVVYNDEHFLRIYDGAGSATDTDGDGFADPVILFEVANPSGTLLEYPLIVDIDNDGNAEIVVASNNYAFPGTTGLRVFGDATDNWVRTRRIWNQHAYHVTHVTEDGAVVAGEPFWWQSRATNSFRLNVQPSGLFNAPNLVVEALSWDQSRCDSRLVLTARIANLGSLGVREGIAVVFWLGEETSGTVLCATETEASMPPGARVDVVCQWDLLDDAPRTGLSFTVTVDRPVGHGPMSRVCRPVERPDDGSGSDEPQTMRRRPSRVLKPAGSSELLTSHSRIEHPRASIAEKSTLSRRTPRRLTPVNSPLAALTSRIEPPDRVTPDHDSSAHRPARKCESTIWVFSTSDASRLHSSTLTFLRTHPSSDAPERFVSVSSASTRAQPTR
jgi:hypothetical protein